MHINRVMRASAVVLAFGVLAGLSACGDNQTAPNTSQDSTSKNTTTATLSGEFSGSG